ncbi:hypothetical protein EVAR_98186_1 [Eumeta japonica]|uniref:Uncharacterized protein n=1 Tax=Eumeta variegata TaxID=151549 RepID=A0A4C2A093_EUMVA|nr:hypothetical protein EVAR_98186_1 [Eumeta japonica]
MGVLFLSRFQLPQEISEKRWFLSPRTAGGTQPIPTPKISINDADVDVPSSRGGRARTDSTLFFSFQILLTTRIVKADYTRSSAGIESRKS